MASDPRATKENRDVACAIIKVCAAVSQIQSIDNLRLAEAMCNELTEEISTIIQQRTHELERIEGDRLREWRNNERSTDFLDI